MKLNDNKNGMKLDDNPEFVYFILELIDWKLEFTDVEPSECVHLVCNEQLFLTRKMMLS